MKRIKINVDPSYEVLVGRKLLDEAGALVRDVIPKAQKLLLVTETNVEPLYCKRAVKTLTEAGFEVTAFVFEAGEQSKEPETILKMLKVMAENTFTRTDAVVALGGGVTTDMAGFASAIFLRGIKVIQIPTTLLAQVDASVGGKTGVDLKEGKNLVGAFHQPSLVICDTELLGTLPENVFTEGMSEVIKYAFISDRDLYDTLMTKLTKESDNLDDVVGRCVELKAYVVEKDEFDNGLRQTLNFGHTIGHVIEKNSDYTIPHGYAVAKGMARISKTSPIYGDLKKILELYGFPYEDDTDPEEIIKGIKNDKKKRGDNITAAFVDEIGKCELRTMSLDEFKRYL